MCYSKDYEYPFTLVDLPGVPNDVSDPATAPAISMIKDHIQELDTGQFSVFSSTALTMPQS